MILGFDKFGEWYSNNSTQRTLHDFLYDFNIDEEELERIVGEDIYKLYSDFSYNTLPSVKLTPDSLIDTRIIEYIGEGDFQNWLNNTAKENQTIHYLLYDFDISDKELQGILGGDKLYDTYIKYKPTIKSISDQIKLGLYIDFSLIKYVGYTEYKDWLKTSDKNKQTVYDFVLYFDISLKELEDILPPDLYKYYIQYKI